MKKVKKMLLSKPLATSLRFILSHGF